MVFEVILINGDIYIYPLIDPHCHGNKIWDKIGYNLACVRDFCAYRGVYGDGPSNVANRIFIRPIPIAMATKFGTKLAITWLTHSFKLVSFFTYIFCKCLLLAHGTELAT